MKLTTHMYSRLKLSNVVPYNEHGFCFGHCPLSWLLVKKSALFQKLDLFPNVANFLTNNQDNGKCPKQVTLGSAITLVFHTSPWLAD
jgi:hypothetical protein